MTITEHRNVCGENFQKTAAGETWCAVCGALVQLLTLEGGGHEAMVVQPQLVPALWKTWGAVTDNTVLPEGVTPGKLLDSIENRLDELAVAYKLTLEQYGHLHGEVVELRKRRDELLVANNLAVELRRGAEVIAGSAQREAARLAIVAEHGNNHRASLLDQVQVKGDRAAELFLALRGILEIGKRDLSNSKYDSYFEDAEKLTKDGL